MKEILVSLVATSGASSYVAALFNQPKFPKWLKLLVVFGVCFVAAYLQQTQHPAEGIDLKARVVMVFFAALLLYNNALKALGADWLTKTVTPEAISQLVRFFTAPATFSPPPDPSPEVKAAQALREKLQALDTLKDLLTEVEYKDRRAALIHGGLVLEPADIEESR